MVDMADSERYHDERMSLSAAKLTFVSGNATAPLAPGNKLIAQFRSAVPVRWEVTQVRVH